MERSSVGILWNSSVLNPRLVIKAWEVSGVVDTPRRFSTARESAVDRGHKSLYKTSLSVIHVYIHINNPHPRAEPSGLGSLWTINPCTVVYLVCALDGFQAMCTLYYSHVSTTTICQYAGMIGIFKYLRIHQVVLSVRLGILLPSQHNQELKCTTLFCISL